MGQPDAEERRLVRQIDWVFFDMGAILADGEAASRHHPAGQCRQNSLQRRKLAEDLCSVGENGLFGGRPVFAWQEWFESGHEYGIRDREFLQKGLDRILNFVLIYVGKK